MKVFIRADGGEKIGLGHVMRMMVLAKELKKTNEVVFICRNDDPIFNVGIQILKDNNFKVECIKNNCVDEIVDLQKIYKADCIITDSYDVDENYFNKIKKKFKVSGYVDDINRCYMNVDFILNQNINALDIDYNATTNKDTTFFLGAKYCLIRDEFINSYKKKVINNKVNNILLTLGGMDEKKNTMKILNILSKFDKNVHVVAGSAFSKELVYELDEFSKRHNNILIHKNANMAELMRQCDIAISGCGSTIYELSSMRVPAIGIIISYNQKQVAYKMKSEGLLFEIYDVNECEENLESCIEKLVSDNEIRKEIIEHQERIVNIFGKYELTKGINKIMRG